jgi:hypothetical protein
VRIEVRVPVSALAQDTTGVQESECPFGYPTSLDVLPANRHILEVEPRGFEPLTSAVQMRPDESATVRLHPKCAANTHILVDDIGSLVRPIPLATAWVGVRLVSEPDDRSTLGKNRWCRCVDSS